MPEFRDTPIEVVQIGDGMMELRIGPEGFQVDMARVKDLMGGAETQEALIRNIAIRLKLAGTDPDDPIAVKAALERTTFKYVR